MKWAVGTCWDMLPRHGNCLQVESASIERLGPLGFSRGMLGMFFRHQRSIDMNNLAVPRCWDHVGDISDMFRHGTRDVSARLGVVWAYNMLTQRDQV